MKKSKMFYVLMVVVVVALLGGMYGIINYAETIRDKKEIAKQSAQQSDAENANIELLDNLQKIKLNHTKYGYRKSIKTYLIMGTDHSGAENETGKNYAGSMADFLLLVVIDEENETYGMIQINRDTMTEVPMMNQDGSSYATASMQLCTAHWFGGNKKMSCKNTVKTVSKLFGGIRIDGYYAISMDTIPKINHLVGGVEVTIRDDFSQLDESLKMGETMKLNDEQALNYIQGRMNVGDGENTSRMARQREYMNQLAEVIRKKGSKDNRFVKNILNELKGETTSDISVGEMYNQYKKAANYTSQGTLVPEGTGKKGETLDDGKEHAEFYMDKNSKYDIMNKLYQLETIEQK